MDLCAAPNSGSTLPGNADKAKPNSQEFPVPLSGTTRRNAKSILEKRYVFIGGKETSIALEKPYWRFLQYIGETVGKDWRFVALAFLVQQPRAVRSRAAWLRVALLGYVLVRQSPNVYQRVFLGAQ